MAVTIRGIPGVGDIQVEGVASEATMERILAAIEKSPFFNKDKSKANADAQDKAAQAASRQANSTQKLTREQETAQAKAQRLEVQRQAAMVQASADLKKFAGNLAVNLTSLAASFAVMHDKVATDPIGAGADLMNAGVDLMTRSVKGATGALGALGEGIPVIGGVLKGMSTAAQAAADALAAAAKMANNFLAAELKKTTEAMKTFTAAGASFAGGLTEMRTVATASGLNLKSFTEVIKNSRENITMMGLTASEASVQLGQGMQKTSVLVGRSGMTLRDEMLNMGYSYEEQGALMSGYMASLKAAGTLEKTSREEIARGTRDYAKDLKVLADITGKDAKKAQEEAQKKALEADIMAQLSPEEAKKFQAAYRAMPEYAKKGFLQFVSSGGTAIADQTTNVLMAQNQSIEQLIKGSYDNIKNAGLDSSTVQKRVLVDAANAGKAQMEIAKAGNAAINQAATQGVSSLDNLATATNQVIAAGLYDPSAVKKSDEAAENQAKTADDASKGFARATDAAMKFSIAMENLATKAMPKYADLLGAAFQGIVDTLRQAGIDIPKTEAEIAKEKEKAAAEESDRQRRLMDVGGGLEVDSMNVAAAGGAVLSGPKSGYKPNLTMHGTEAIIPLENNKVPIQFEPGFADYLTKAARMVSDLSNDAAFGNHITVGESYGNEVLKMFEIASSKKQELEKTDEGREKLTETMKHMASVLVSLRESQDRMATVPAGQVGGAGVDPMLEAQNRMIGLLEQFVTKQDETRYEIERSRQAQEYIRDLL